MRYAPDHKEKTRARILEAAGRVFRRQGFHAAGVDRVMEEAGLTSGGFYAHFDSKQALLAEALTQAGAETGSRLDAGLRGLAGRAWVDAFLARYLAPSHRKAMEQGCPLAALVSEVARADGPARESFEAMVRELAARLSDQARGEGRGPGPSDGRALAALALCVGGLGLARAVRDESLADQILEACRDSAGEILCGGTDSTGGQRARRETGPSSTEGGASHEAG
jgi:TetR/AcrR family transcriptional repressor of nem operon